MNVLLLVRSEILACFVLLFLIIYDRICAKYREGKDRFLGFALTGLGHVVMGLATEITVNSTTVPTWFNNLLHILFFLFALWFSLKYYEYSLSLITARGQGKKFILPAYILSAVCLVVMIFSDIDYLQGNGTKYSAGTGPTVCYMLGFVMFILSDIILLVNRKKIDRTVLFSLLPLSFLSLGFMAIQIVVPEFLFTGAALTLTCVGAFFAIENPIGKFTNRAFMDMNTQVWNRNCYEFDLNNKIKNDIIPSSTPWTYVIGDINGLKTVNDTKGHLAGDIMIETIAAFMTDKMANAFRVYRIGGDEFAVLYINKPKETVEAEIAAVQSACEAYNKTSEVPVSISIGYAEHSLGETAAETAKRADENMYAVKAAHYRALGLEPRD